MPRRQSYRQRQMTYGYLVERDGEYCQSCGNPPFSEPRGILEIHHVNGDAKDDRLLNKRLVHKSCHASGHNVTRHKRVSNPGDQGESERERETETVPGVGPGVPIVVDPDASPELRLNQAGRPRFLAWLFRYIEEHGSIAKREAIASGAKLTGLSVQTITRYLIPELSELGDLEEIAGNGSSVLVRRRTKQEDGTDKIEAFGMRNLRLPPPN